MMRINEYLMPILTIILLVGTVWAAKATGYWQTSGREMINLNDGLSAGDLRGWMSLEILSDGFDIPMDELLAMLGLPPDTPPVKALKDLENIIEVSEVRAIMATYKGETLPEHDELEEHRKEREATPETPATQTMPTPTPILTETDPVHTPGSQDGAGQEAGQEHKQGAGQGMGRGTGQDQPVLQNGQLLTAEEIKGRMTLQEVSDQCGVPLDVLYTRLNLPDNIPADTALKTLKEQVEGFEVGAVRNVVADYQ